MNRSIVLVLAAVVLLLITWSCTRDERVPAASKETSSTPASTQAKKSAADAASENAALALASERNTALYAAVDTVQRYLTAAGSAEWPRADAFWGYRRTPSASDEGGLRALMPPRAMRIQSDSPRVLDSAEIPEYVEVPVTLRIDLAKGGQARFSGWYRVRRNPVEQRWELVAASMAPQLR